MSKIKLVLSGLFFLTRHCKAFALDQDLPIDTPLENVLSQGVIYEGGILRAILSLLIVIGLIYLTAWAYKRLNIFNTSKLVKTQQQTGMNKFKVISSQSLGANKNLHVVEINGKYLVLGSTQNNISLIKEFDKILIESAESKISAAQEADNDIMKDLLDKYGDFENDITKRD